MDAVQSTYMARQRSTGFWLSGVLSPSPSPDLSVIVEHFATAHALPASDVDVVVTDWSSAERVAAGTAMATGMYEGIAVVPYQSPPKPPDPDAVLGAAIDGATTLSELKKVLRDYLVTKKRSK